MKMFYFYVSLILIIQNALCAAGPEGVEREDPVLVSERVTHYFVDLATKMSKPIVLTVGLTDNYGAGSKLEDEESIEPDKFPRQMSRSWLVSVLREKFPVLLDSFTAGKSPSTIALSASIWVPAEGHKEKIHGFCDLG